MVMIAKREIGTTGCQTTVFGLGGTGLGNMYCAVEDKVACELVVAAYSAGVRYFDTAPDYGCGLSEIRMGRVLSTLPRNEFVISTKVGKILAPLADGVKPPDFYKNSLPFSSEFDFSYDAALHSIEGSLKRLGLNHVDLVAIHDPDECAGVSAGGDLYANSHFKEAMEGSYKALHELRSQGVIRGIGVGINQWQMLVDFAKAGDFDYFLMAGRYTLLEQEAMTALFPLCAERRISIIAGGPFNSGILASGAVEGAYYNYRPAAPEVLTRVRRFEAVCASFKVSLRAAALQFPLGHPVVASVIPGARTAQEFQENLTALRQPIPEDFWFTLTAESLIDKDAPVPSQ